MKALGTALSLLSLLLAGCATSPSTHAHCKKLVEQVGGLSLSRAAALTVRDYVGAHPGTRGVSPSPNVAQEWWHEPIHDLNPVRVYMHYFDVVIVLSESEKVEAGLCVNTPGQSWVGGMMMDKAVELRALYNPEAEDPNTIFGSISSYVRNKQPNI
jgi:hypothetical protein